MATIHVSSSLASSRKVSRTRITKPAAISVKELRDLQAADLALDGRTKKAAQR